jgi:hypothetical protein
MGLSQSIVNATIGALANFQRFLMMTLDEQWSHQNRCLETQVVCWNRSNQKLKKKNNERLRVSYTHYTTTHYHITMLIT